MTQVFRMFALSIRFVERGTGPVEMPCAVFDSSAEASRFFAEEFGNIPNAHPLIVSCPCARALAVGAGERRGDCGCLLSANPADAPGCGLLR